MDILTFPIGLVVGMLPVVTSPGPGTPATVLLDGTPVCTVTVEAPRCEVDLGPRLAVHLLELRRTDSGGKVTERTSRWVNRPGSQTEVFLRGSCDQARGQCDLSFGWGHPARLEPRWVAVTVNGKVVSREVVHSITVPGPEGPSALVASVDVTFPDGRRASRTLALGGQEAASVETALTPIVISAEAGTDPTTLRPTTLAGLPVRAIEDAPTEVVFVIEPGALHLTHAAEPPDGIHDALEARETGTNLARVRAGQIPSAAPLLADTEGISLVLADGRFRHRPITVESSPRNPDTWLDQLVSASTYKPDATLRLADAVAVAGQIAAGGPRRRAVVLVLSSKHHDDSTFAPADVQHYLQQIMVPLQVWRAGRPRADGWPQGMTVNARSLVKAVRAIRDVLDRQRVAWVEGDFDSRSLAILTDQAGAVQAGGAPGAAAPALTVGPPGEGHEARQGASASQAAVAARVSVTAVHVVVRAFGPDGSPVTGLEPGELVVQEDDAPATVVSVERLAGAPRPPSPGPPATAPEQQPVASAQWRVAVYVMPELCGRGELPRALARLADQAPSLVGTGPVSIVLAAEEPELIADGITDAGVLARTLTHSRANRQGVDRISRVRRETENRVNQTPPMRGLQLVQTLQTAVREELAVVARELGTLQRWGRQGENRAGRLLLLVMDGFDLDPATSYLDTYGAVMSVDERTRVRDFQENLRRGGLAGVVSDTVAALVRVGWTIVSLDSGAGGVALATSAEHHTTTATSAFAAANHAPSPGQVLGPMLGFEQRRAPLVELADGTGGEVLTPGGTLDEVVDELRHAYLVTYQVDRPADGKAHRLEVTTSRPGVTLRVAKQVLSGTSEEESALLARHLLTGAAAPGELPVTVSLWPGDSPRTRDATGRLGLIVDLSSVLPVLATLPGSQLRVTVVVPDEDGEPFVHHDVSRLEGATTGTWRYSVAMTWPRSARRIAVLVEELATGARGGVVTDLPR